MNWIFAEKQGLLRHITPAVIFFASPVTARQKQPILFPIAAKLAVLKSSHTGKRLISADYPKNHMNTEAVND